MTARTWAEADPAPKDWPVVVGPDGVTWGHDEDAERDGLRGFYHQQKITHFPNSSMVTLGTGGLEFAEIFYEYPEGAVLREATDEEERTWVETWTNPTSSGVSGGETDGE